MFFGIKLYPWAWEKLFLNHVSNKEPAYRAHILHTKNKSDNLNTNFDQEVDVEFHVNSNNNARLG